MRWFSIGAALLSLACGARSALIDSGQLDGGSGVGAGGGTGGGSGGVSACSGFDMAASTAYVPSLGPHLDSSPAFVDPPNDTAHVTLAFVRLGALSHLRFAAWDEWPPEPSMGFPFTSFSEPTSNSEIRVAPSLEGAFAATAVLSSTVTFAPQIDPDAKGAGLTLPLLGTKPLFLSALGDEAFVIGTLSIQRELYVQIAEPSLQDPVPIATIGCADDDIVGGAAPYENGWLLVHSNGKNAPAAVCEPPATATAGPATRIDIVKLEKSSITSLLTSLNATSLVRELVVAQHPDGVSFAWLDGSVHFARYVAKTGAIVGPVVISDATESPSGLAMSAFGNGSLIAYSRSGESLLVGKLLDASGNEQASFTLEPDFVGKPAIIGVFAQHAALLAYEDTTGLMAITRWSCEP